MFWTKMCFSLAHLLLQSLQYLLNTSQEQNEFYVGGPDYEVSSKPRYIFLADFRNPNNICQAQWSQETSINLKNAKFPLYP